MSICHEGGLPCWAGRTPYASHKRPTRIRSFPLTPTNLPVAFTQHNLNFPSCCGQGLVSQSVALPWQVRHRNMSLYVSSTISNWPTWMFVDATTSSTAIVMVTFSKCERPVVSVLNELTTAVSQRTVVLCLLVLGWGCVLCSHTAKSRRWLRR